MNFNDGFERLYLLVRKYPHIVSQSVAAIVSILISYGVLQFSPEQAEKVASEITWIIFAAGQIIAAFVGQNWSTPWPPLDEDEEDIANGT